MSDMVERVARAIYAVDGGKGWHLHEKFYVASARAAIEAMRQTTNTMDIAGVKHLREHPSDASGCFEALIDAALSNSKGGEG